MFNHALSAQVRYIHIQPKLLVRSPSGRSCSLRPLQSRSMTRTSKRTHLNECKSIRLVYCCVFNRCAIRRTRSRLLRVCCSGKFGLLQRPRPHWPSDMGSGLSWRADDDDDGWRLRCWRPIGWPPPQSYRRPRDGRHY